MTESTKTKRYPLFDTVRGITIISMIIYHTCWDLWFFRMGISDEFLFGNGAYIWQQSICWTFILLSGFCFLFGKHHLKRGLLALGGGIIITIVTCIVLPEERDVFGVLWLIGSATLIAFLLKPLIIKVNPAAGLFVSAACFFIFRNVNRGYLGFEGLNLVRLPSGLYHGYLLTFLGFPDPSFYSSDYFSFLPWFFLFLTGSFLNRVFFEKMDDDVKERLFGSGIRPLSFIGRHSLIIYMLHQPAVYLSILLIRMIFKIG